MEKIAQNLSVIPVTLQIKEEIIKQINTLKPFDMEPRKALPKKKSLHRKKKITVKRKLI